MLELWGAPWSAKVDSQEGNGKQVGRNLQVVAGSFCRPCLSSRAGCHKRKGPTKAPGLHRNCFRKDMSGPGSPKDGPAPPGRALLVERFGELVGFLSQKGWVVLRPLGRELSGATSLLPSCASKHPSDIGKSQQMTHVHAMYVRCPALLFWFWGNNCDKQELKSVSF